MPRPSFQPSSTRPLTAPKHLLLAAFVISSLLPYLAISVGNNSNLPLSSVLAACLIIAGKILAEDLLRYALLAASPWFATFAASLGGWLPVQPSIAGLIAWTAWTLPALALVSVIRSGWLPQFSRLTKSSLFISCVYALWQYTELRAGRIPFLQWYTAAGYASVQRNAESILSHTSRPFGQFPEPSFLASTLILGVAVVLLAEYHVRREVSRSAWLLCVLVFIVLYLARSGVVVFCLPMLLILVFAVAGVRARLVFIIATPYAALMVLRVLADRTRSADYSWSDRLGALLSAFDFQFSSWQTALFGLGRDATVLLFQHHLIPIHSLVRGYYPQGLYSSVGKYWVEGGLLFGVLPTLLILAYISGCGLRDVGKVAAVGAIGIWLVVSVLALGYDSASWIWISLGLFSALRFGAESISQPESEPYVVGQVAGK